MTMGVYSITNNLNGHRYIGSSIHINRRFQKHQLLLARNSHHSLRLQNAWNFYGRPTFVFEILEEIKIASLLVGREQFWMGKFKSTGDYGYNVAPKTYSSLGRTSTKETCLKISKGNIGRIFSAETRMKISNKNRGRKFSEITKENMSIAAKRRGAHSSETYAKIANALRGQVRSTQARENISLGKKGKEFSEAHKLSLSLTWVIRKLKYPSTPRHSKTKG